MCVCSSSSSDIMFMHFFNFQNVTQVSKSKKLFAADSWTKMSLWFLQLATGWRAEKVPAPQKGRWAGVAICWTTYGTLTEQTRSPVVLFDKCGDHI